MILRSNLDVSNSRGGARSFHPKYSDIIQLKYKKSNSLKFVEMRGNLHKFKSKVAPNYSALDCGGGCSAG